MAVALVAAVLILTGRTLVLLTAPPRRTYGGEIARSRPGDPGEMSPEQGGPRHYDSWRFESRGRVLHVWDIRGDDPAGPVVVMTHGWGDSKIGSLVRLAAFLPRASRVIAWDMPGHGESGGRSTLGVKEPSDLRELLQRIGSDKPVILMGWSLGAGVSIAAAAQEGLGIAAVIAEAPYRIARTPAHGVMETLGFPATPNLPFALWLLGIEFGLGPTWKGFDRAALAARLCCPLLVLHGTSDEVCPVQDGRDIASAAPDGSMLEIEGGTHLSLWSSPETRARVMEGVDRFLLGLGANQQGKA